MDLEGEMHANPQKKKRKRIWSEEQRIWTLTTNRAESQPLQVLVWYSGCFERPQNLKVKENKPKL